MRHPTAPSRSDDPRFRRQPFKLHVDRFTFDNWGILPDAGFQPISGTSPLGERLPINWESHYRDKYEQSFQPAVFYRNAAALANMAVKKPESARACSALFDELFSALMAHSVLEDNRRFITNNFDFLRFGTVLPSGWSGSIMNAFAVAGLLKAIRQFRNPRHAAALAEFANAFDLLHYHGQEPPPRWISHVDEEGYLWFDEYPLPDGKASCVLNGHIFSVFALAMYFHRTGDETFLPLVEGGLTTVKETTLRFRRPGQTNLYDLRNPNYADYAPNRTIKQQAQLYALTGDSFFRGMAYIFTQDFKDQGDAELASWALHPIKAVLDT